MTLVQPAEGELKLNGLRIHYFEWKGKGTRPLVLMHGLRDYAYYWQDCANRLLDEFHIFAPDHARARGERVGAGRVPGVGAGGGPGGVCGCGGAGAVRPAGALARVAGVDGVRAGELAAAEAPAAVPTWGRRWRRWGRAG